jgi:hypothetical protein
MSSGPRAPIKPAARRRPCLAAARLQELAARIITQSHDAFHRAQARAGPPPAAAGDLYAAAAAETQLRRDVRETLRELGDEAGRAAELRAALAAVSPRVCAQNRPPARQRLPQRTAEGPLLGREEGPELI